MVLIHATCVAIDNEGVLIRGPSGRGKSDLALRLIDDGAHLVADDICEVTVDGNILTATAPTRIAGLMEIRGVGIVEAPHLPRAKIALVVDLEAQDAIPRLPDRTEIAIAGVSVRWIALDPDTASAPAKIRAALRMRRRDEAMPATAVGA